MKTATTCKSQGQDYKDFVGIFLCDMDYYPWFFIVLCIKDRVSSRDCQDLVLSSTVVTGKERLMKMPNIQYVCLSGSEVILTLSSYHFCWILSSLNSFSLQKKLLYWLQYKKRCMCTYPSLQWVGVLGWFAFLEIHYPLMYIIYISISFISIIILKPLVVLKAPSDWLLKLQVSFVIHLQATTTLL